MALGILFALIVIAVVHRLLLASWGKRRIIRYVGEKGGQAEMVRWAPFGPSALTERRERIYSVVYVDADGLRHKAYCKTSMFSGVFWTQDTVKNASMDSPATPAERIAQLEVENRHLRDELERYRARK